MEDSYSAEEVSELGEFGKGNMEVASKDAKTRKTIIARQTAINHPMMSDAMRRTRLGLKEGEVAAHLTFVVPKSQVLDLPPTPEDNFERSRVTLCRRFEDLHPSRREDDASYLDAVEKGTEVTLVTALPADYEKGGWRCHDKKSSTDYCDQVVECLHVNTPDDECCAKCQSPKPNIRPEFAYLRLLPLGMRRQRKEYVRIIKECDSELERCDAAEREATDRIAAFERESDRQQKQGVDSSAPNSTSDTSETATAEEQLTMDVDLVQKGAWQRVNARILLPTLATRKLELIHRLKNARTEVSIMIQATFGLAVPHVQRVSRRFLVRIRLDKIRKSVLDLARFSAAVSAVGVQLLHF